MHVTQYTTILNHPLWQIPACEMGTPMASAATVEFGNEPLPHPVQGFGAALTGSSCYNLSLMEKEERKKLLRELYGSDGLGLSMARLTVGSSDYSPELYTYDDVPGDTELTHFSTARDEKYIFPMIKEVLEEAPDLYLYASPWSPPGWMKTGGLIPGGYMRDAYISCYVGYYMKYLEDCDRHGIHVRALTPQNEPDTDTNGHYPGCRWHPETEAKFIHEMYAALKAAGRDTKIWMFDHNFNGWRRVQWMLREDPKLLEEVDSASFHYYEECAEFTDVLTREFPGLKLQFTEGGPRVYDHYDSDHCKWGLVMTRAFRHGCRSFTGWNLILDETGGPNIGPFFCAGLVARDSRTGAISYSGQYRAFAHFTKFLQPGARVLPCRILNDGLKFFHYPETGTPADGCAFRNPDGSTVLVLTNPSGDRKQLQCQLDGKWYYLSLLPDSISTVIAKK